MGRFLRGLRKSFKKACLTTALVTCWNIGNTAYATLDPPPDYGDEVTMHFSGSVTPTSNDVSHLFLIFGTGLSSVDDIYAAKIGDFSAGQSTPFSFETTVKYNQDLVWVAAGLHGDVNGGQYLEGINGVTLAMPSISEGYPWENYASTNIDTMFTLLLNDDVEHLASYHLKDWNYDDFNSPGTIIDLWDFSNANQNGQMSLAFEIVPEPISIVLFGGGSIIIMASRRRKD